MNFLLSFLLLLLFPTLTFASGMTKQEACEYPEGIAREEVYVLWPGKLPQIDGFLKKEGFLYYFIHTFSDRNTLSAYRDAGNTSWGFIRNTGSYLVSYDCTKSKVKFYPSIRSLGGTAYGKLNWISGNFLSYSLAWDERDPCKIWPDALLDIQSMAPLKIDRLSGLPRSTEAICIGRGAYKNIKDGIVQFDIEEHTWETEESFYSRYQYYLSTKKLKKIR